MTASEPHIVEEEFVEAKNNWELEKLYIDLASAKGKALTPVEKKFLRGLLCGLSPAEIASTVYKSKSSSTVRVYLSNGLYKYIEEMLSIQASTNIKVKNWSRVTQLLEKAGYKKTWLQLEAVSNLVTTNYPKKEAAEFVNMQTTQQDWGEATDVSVFYGRQNEIAQAQDWIIQERCRLVVLLGMGGIGKTTLSIKLAQKLHSEFDFIIWRSLQLAPPLEVLLNQLIQFLSVNPDMEIADSLEGSISQLIEYLRSARCLIVLDAIDAVLSGDVAESQETGYTLAQIKYLPGYEGYGELIRRLGESSHQSCVLLTSREQPQAIAALSGNSLPVRVLKLTGLGYGDGLEVLKAKGFSNIKQEEYQFLIDWYAGNPLFLKLVGTAIQDLFGGSIYEFIEQGTVVFGEIRAVLDEQFQRLSQLEKQVMYWLALNQDFLSLRKLQRDIVPRVSQRLILEAIELLQRKSLIERQTASFSQTPVLMEYIAECLIEENMRLSSTKASSLLMNQTIFETQLKNYIRELRFNADNI
ncbi:NB-ARC domain-containing protein [Calothrix sp. UHCC 0171]|uniref:NB-ARC domain-containing protein n=1 Tax=Calothrix sp. UHCC 0171 TaxID=3110245 RepID=UPI002B1FD859|nr:NB-ARC domain-containing protein [Calothrix sp. UHCC 0171]MEA5571214.1 NB-ARC domain-containing protein [Calothrix sp. UHCC 0171]